MSPLRTKFVIASVFALAFALPNAAREDAKRSDAYREGQDALEDQDWDEASRIYAKLAASGSGEVDAALYWKAYADWKRGQKKEALDGVRKLLASYPQSAWADDAKALELEMRDGKAAARASTGDDEELKLYALDGLMQMEPGQAVPILEKLLAGDASRRVKERALFVLSQSDSPRAREILLRTAKSGQPIALRCEAVRTLGIAGQPEDLEALATIARDTTAPYEVRTAVVDAYLISNRPEALVGLATSDPDPKIRSKAIDALGAIGALPSLRQLWSSEKDPAVRAKLLEAFGVAGDVDTLMKAARESTDPKLGISGGPAAGRALRQLYGEFTAPDDKRKVAESLMVHGEAKILIELFRAEKDPGMKRVLLQQISVMDDPEIQRLLMEVLGE
jgi:HEAT repeat protein